VVVALNRHYTKESLFRIIDNIKGKDGIDRFLDSIAPVIPTITDYDFASALILKLLMMIHSHTYILDQVRTERISNLISPVLANVITNFDVAKQFLSGLTDGKSEFYDPVKEGRIFFASKLHHVIHNSADLEVILSLLKDADLIPFVIKQNNYWFEHQKNCRLAFLSGRSPKYAETHGFFGRLDRNLCVRIFREAGLLPTPAVEPALKKLKN
jgi:hypothetical protein